MSSNVIHLDLASQKLLVKPDDPIPEFYPPPRAVMITPIYNDAEIPYGGDRDHRSSRYDHGRGRRNTSYSPEPSRRNHDYDRERRYGRRGGSSSPSYRGRYSDDSDGYDTYDDEARKRSRPSGTEPPRLPPPDISHYPGGSGNNAHRSDHGRATYQPQNKLHKRRTADSRRSRGGDSYGRRGDYPPTSDSDDYPDDDSFYSYTGGRGGGTRGRRSRPQGTEPPKLPPPDISGYPGGGHAGTAGAQGHAASAAHGHAQSSQGHQAPAPSGQAHSQYAPSGQPHSQYAPSGQPHSQYAPSGQPHGQYAQSGQPHSQYAPSGQAHSQHSKKPGLIDRLFSSGAGSARGHSGAGHAHGGQYIASHRPSAVPGHPVGMGVPSSSGSTVSHVHGGGRGPATQGGAGTAQAKAMKLSPITQAFLRIAAKKGYGDEISRYINQLPPSPDFCWGKCSGSKKAVLIGINYVGMKDELKGCANDARNMRDFLINVWHFNPANIVLITDEKEHRTSFSPTRREMFNAMAWLTNNAKANDSLFFHYSGHGGQAPDASGKELDGQDEVIYPLDYDDAGDIIDDELHDALVKPLPPGCRLTAVFDSCHSGTVLDLPYLHSSHGRLRSMQHISKRAQQRGAGDAADVISICACKDDETSADTHQGNVAVGAMSYALIQALKGNPDQTYEELLTHLREILIPKYHQKAQISGTHPLDLDRKFIL